MGLPITPCPAPVLSRTPAPSWDKAEVTAIIAIHEPFEDVKLSAILRLSLLQVPFKAKSIYSSLICLFFQHVPRAQHPLTIVKIMAPSRA